MTLAQVKFREFGAFDISSTRTPRDRHVEQQCDDGSPRMRRQSRARLWDFHFVWRFRSLKQVQRMEAIWAEIYSDSFTFQGLEGEWLVGKFSAAPQSTMHDQGFYEIVVDLVGRAVD